MVEHEEQAGVLGAGILLGRVKLSGFTCVAAPSLVNPPKRLAKLYVCCEVEEIGSFYTEAGGEILECNLKFSYVYEKRTTTLSNPLS